MVTNRNNSKSIQLKICHIAATTEGATWMYEQLRDLRSIYGFDVSAIISGNNGALVDNLKKSNIPFHVCDFEFIGSKDLLSLPFKIIKLARLLRREKFDVVQTHLFHSMVIGRLAAWLANIPVRISMIAGPYHLEAYTPKWVDRATCWMDSEIIASCEYTRKLYREMGVKDKNIGLVYYGPDQNKFDSRTTKPATIRSEFGWAADTPLIVMIAYFYPPHYPSRWTPPALWGKALKGHQDLINAMPIVLSSIPKARCILVGSGWGEAGIEYKTKMEKLVSSLGLDKEILFTGFRTDINNILRAADVSVQPSLNENLGGTIESLLMECPTVATRIGGMTDSIINNKTGILVEPSNPKDLACGIIKILKNPSNAKLYGHNGRQLMLKKFVLSKTVSNLQNIYIRLYAKAKKQVYLFVLLTRALIFIPFSAYFAIRLFFIDILFLSKWDAGWRPWKIKALLQSIYAPVRFLKLFPYHIYGLLRSISANTKALETWDLIFAKIKSTKLAFPRIPNKSLIFFPIKKINSQWNFYIKNKLFRFLTQFFIEVRLKIISIWSFYKKSKLFKFWNQFFAEARLLKQDQPDSMLIIIKILPYHIYGFVRECLEGTKALYYWDRFLKKIRENDKDR